MKLKKITFVFENCDCITIDGKYVGRFLVDDLHTEFRRVACNSIEKIETVNTFAIEIHKDANKERYQFDQEQIEDFKQTTFDRLKAFNDIVSIDFELEENYVEEGQVPCIEYYAYYVNWVGESEYSNEAQTYYISSDGNFYMVVADGKTIEDFFDMEEINDSESMDFYFFMCDIGDKYNDPDRYKNE